MKFPGVVAVLCVVPSGLVLYIEITSCTFPPWTEMSKKNDSLSLHQRKGHWNNSLFAIKWPYQLSIASTTYPSKAIEINW